MYAEYLIVALIAALDAMLLALRLMQHSFTNYLGDPPNSIKTVFHDVSHA
jgi:hypothetical protein